MYIGKSEAGALHEGRKDNYAGNTMRPGALTKYHKIYNFHLSQAREDWSVMPLTEFRYEIEIRSYLPISMILDLEERPLKVKRLETMSFWHASYQEVLRHLGLAQKARQSEMWEDIMSIVDSFKEEIKDAIIGYIRGCVEQGNASFEHFNYYAKMHEESASPFGGKWSDILKSPSQLRYAYAECLRFVKEYNDDIDKILRYDSPLIKIQHVYPALRARPADYTILEISNDRIIAQCSKTRDRKAGGVEGTSQLEWQLYDQTDAKRKVYDENFYSLIRKISGCELNTIVLEGAKFYQDVILAKPNCYDLRNAEKLVGQVLYFWPFNVDLGEPHYPSEYAAELYSGIGPTRPGSELVVAILVRLLKEKGFEVGKLFLGGDNFGFPEKIDCQAENLDIFLTNEESLLGLMPKEERFGPYSFITDSVKNRLNIPKDWKSISMIQSYQNELRPLQVVVNNDIYRRGSCKDMIDWIVENKLLQNLDVYNKDTIAAYLYRDEELRTKFMDKFAAEMNFIKTFIPTHSNPNRSTDAHMTVYR